MNFFDHELVSSIKGADKNHHAQEITVDIAKERTEETDQERSVACDHWRASLLPYARSATRSPYADHAHAAGTGLLRTLMAEQSRSAMCNDKWVVMLGLFLLPGND
ncbi:hypothetical protein [Vogesella indigofera]|uniref:hypothetical protein n=1 Tax=Vogesella indigofera TaxID=45465 RepID=UPI00234C2D70|nr:hypothetical protein [Vogesella indigofera]MDC7702796.1 hypothetical protein [Vogesella indigofera]